MTKLTSLQLVDPCHFWIGTQDGLGIEIERDSPWLIYVRVQVWTGDSWVPSWYDDELEDTAYRVHHGQGYSPLYDYVAGMPIEPTATVMSLEA